MGEYIIHYRETWEGDFTVEADDRAGGESVVSEFIENMDHYHVSARMELVDSACWAEHVTSATGMPEGR